jgi:putative FmdB family regulatory protein
MPTYDFTCMTCEDRVSIVQGIDATLHIPICAKCAHKMVRSFSLSAVTFNGSGWASKEK